MAIPLDYGTGRGVKKDAMGDLIDDETAGSGGLQLVPAGVMFERIIASTLRRVPTDRKTMMQCQTEPLWGADCCPETVQ